MLERITELVNTVSKDTGFTCLCLLAQSSMHQKLDQGAVSRLRCQGAARAEADLIG